MLASERRFILHTSEGSQGIPDFLLIGKIGALPDLSSRYYYSAFKTCLLFPLHNVVDYSSLLFVYFPPSWPRLAVCVFLSSFDRHPKMETINSTLPATIASLLIHFFIRYPVNAHRFQPMKAFYCLLAPL